MNSQGYLEIICGPMFSGKSEELIKRLRRAKLAQKQILTYKHAYDTRSSLEYLASHDGSRIQAFSITDPHAMLEQAHSAQASVIGIDEVQFFGQDILPIVCTLIDNNIRVIVAGLDLNFRGEPFGPMPLLLAIADEITKLRAVCLICGNDAHYTQRLVNGKPALYQDPLIVIGAHESYQARCRNCYVIDRHPKIFYEQTKNIL